MRNPALAALALALAACSEPPAAPAPAAPAPPAVAAPKAAPLPAGDAAPLAPVAPLAADHAKGRIPESQEKDALAAAQELARLELTGTFTGAKGASYLVHVLPGPCDTLVGAAAGTTFGDTPPSPMVSWAAEAFAPPRVPVHVCGAALDAKGQVIAYGGWKENPLIFSGEGENQRSGLVLALDALPAPKPLAKFQRRNRPKPATGIPPPVPPALKVPLGPRPR